MYQCTNLQNWTNSHFCPQQQCKVPFASYPSQPSTKTVSWLLCPSVSSILKPFMRPALSSFLSSTWTAEHPVQAVGFLPLPSNPRGLCCLLTSHLSNFQGKMKDYKFLSSELYWLRYQNAGPNPDLKQTQVCYTKKVVPSFSDSHHHIRLNIWIFLDCSLTELNYFPE